VNRRLSSETCKWSDR